MYRLDPSTGNMYAVSPCLHINPILVVLELVIDFYRYSVGQHANFILHLIV